MMLEFALDTSLCSNDYFRVVLRALWRRRAQQCYDFRSTHFPYILHYYTMENDGPFMYGNSNLYFRRSTLDFSDRNPPASRSDLVRHLSIHGADRSSNGEFDIFSYYNTSGMHRAESYFEDYVDQFYRILFFFVESTLTTPMMVDCQMISYPKKFKQFFTMTSRIGIIFCSVDSTN